MSRHPMSSTGWDLVIFDNDGVLVDSERLANQVLAEVLNSIGGRHWTPEVCLATFSGGTLGRVRALVEAGGQPLPGDFEARYHAALFEAFDAHLQPVAGVAEVLDRLPWPVCVASSSSHPRLERSLRVAGLWERVAGRVFSADDVAAGKPAPDLFLHAAGTLGATPARCAVVEDSLLGVAAARAAGMAVFAYSPPARRGGQPAGGPAAAPDPPPGATAAFGAMAELPGLLAAHAPLSGGPGNAPPPRPDPPPPAPVRA